MRHLKGATHLNSETNELTPSHLEVKVPQFKAHMGEIGNSQQPDQDKKFLINIVNKNTNLISNDQQ